MDISFNFEGKTALVTGAGKGIGREISKLLNDSKAKVIAVGRTKENLETLKQEIGCEIIVADLSDISQCEMVGEKAGTIDFLINNAGIALNDSFLETKVEDFELTFQTNVRSVLILSQIFIKKMIQHKIQGSIVNISSQASTKPLSLHTSYCTSKAALDHLTRVIALEVGVHGIRVNTINPTVVLTEMGEKNWSDPKKSEPMLQRIGLGRFASSNEVAQATAFLLSSGSSMIHGADIKVDGGFN